MIDIILYPSNWLYNAGVIGFLSCLDREDYLENMNSLEFKYIIEENNTIHINKDIFIKIKIEENYFENGKVVNLKGKNPYYPNFIDAQGNQKDVFKIFIEAFSELNITEQCDCELCGVGLLVKKDNLDNEIDNDSKKNFFNKISNLNIAHNKLLGPSTKFPNSYWNLEIGLNICHLCTFILIHHHLAFTKLSDGSQIFINAPSFKLMYELNKLVKELFGKGEFNVSQKREILSMSIIEYTRRLQTTLGLWNAMNIEIVMKKEDLIEFYSLPYDTINLISDREIATLLSEIGEFSVLDSVISGNIQKLEKISYKLIRSYIKENKDMEISNLIKLEKNKNNKILTAQKILQLYTIIIDRRKKWQKN